MELGTRILMVRSGDGSVERGQVGRIVGPLDADEGHFPVEWDDGRRTFFPSGDTEVAVLRDDIVCDFCSATPVAWRCHTTHERVDIANQVAKTTFVTADNTDWAACDTCKHLVEQGDRKALVERSAKRLRRKSHVPLGVATGYVKRAHGAFWSVFAHKITPEGPRGGVEGRRLARRVEPK